MLTIFRNPRSGRPDDQPSERSRNYQDNTPHSPASSPLSPYTDKPTPDPVPLRETPQTSISPSRMTSTAHTTLIGQGMVFDGELKGDGSVRVEGQLIGTINVKNEVIVGDSGIVEGNIKSQVVTVLGKLRGNVEAVDKITIDVSGSMIGDIAAPRVVVAEGAIYKGKIDMEPQSQSGDKKKVSEVKKEKVPDAQNRKPQPQPQPQPKPAPGEKVPE
jgi:cytoskeletal protein CcmA (bactofilin family)